MKLDSLLDIGGCDSKSLLYRQIRRALQGTGGLKDDMIGCLTALETSLLPCLPARELQAIDRSPHPSHQIDVERHARDFMEAAKKLQLYFIGLQREEQSSQAETLRKEIVVMEEELKRKDELIKKHEKLIQGWRKELKDQLDKHRNELERVSINPPTSLNVQVFNSV